MKGFIYMITNPETEQVYIGSTAVSPNKRFIKHKSEYKCNRRYCSSWEILKFKSASKCVILDEIEFNDKNELYEEEYLYTVLYEDFIVNKQVPNRDKKQYVKDKSEYLKLWYRELRKKNKYYLKKVKCEICGKIISNTHLRRHQRTGACVKILID